MVTVSKIVAEMSDIPLPYIPSQSNTSMGLMPINSIEYQQNSPDDLKVISWPEGIPFAEISDYAYANDWRARPIIYIIDTQFDHSRQVGCLVETSIWACG